MILTPTPNRTHILTCWTVTAVTATAALQLLYHRTEPTILYLDIGGLIKRRLESLSELLPGHDVVLLVKKVPRLLTTNVSSLAQKVFQI